MTLAATLASLLRVMPRRRNAAAAAPEFPSASRLPDSERNRHWHAAEFGRPRACLMARVGPGLRPGPGLTGCDRLRGAASRIRHARGVLAIVLARGRSLGHVAIECDRACTTPRLGPGSLSNRELPFAGAEVGSASVDEIDRLPLRVITRKNALPRKRSLLAADEPASRRAFRRLHIDAEQLTSATRSHLASADKLPRTLARAHDISRPTGRHLNL